MNASAPVAQPESRPRLSHLERVINLFFSPGATFADLRYGAGWWVPWMILALVGWGFIFTVDRQVSFQTVAEQQIAQNLKAVEQFDKMPAEQRAGAMALQIKIMRVMSYISPVMVLITGCVIAAIFMVVYNFGFGADVKFPVALAIQFYAWLPSVIGSLLGILTLFLREDHSEFNIQNPVATNPGYFLNPADGAALYSLASSLDVFTLWTVVLIGVGYSQNSKVSFGKAVGASFAVWAVYVLGKVAFAAIF